MPPVFAAVGAIVASVGAGFTALAGALGLSAGQLGLAALSVAGQLLFSRTPKMPTPEDGKVNLRQPTPPLRRLIGEGEYGGDFNFYRARDGIAYQSLIFSVGPITEFVSIKLHDEVVALNADGYVTAPSHFVEGGSSSFGGAQIIDFITGGGYEAPEPVPTPEGAGSRVRILLQRGTADDIAYPALVEAFPDVLDATFATPGLASMLVLAKSVSAEASTDVYRQGLPSPRARMLGAALYDPREESHDPADPETWAYSASPTLAALDYLTHWSGYNFPISRMYLPDFAASADVDDRPELGWNGLSQARWRCGGRYDLGDLPRKEVLGGILRAADLWLYQRPDGTIGVKPGDWEEPDLVIGDDDDDIIALRRESFDRDRDGAEILRATFTSRDHSFSTVDAAAWPDAADPVALSDRAKKYELPWVQRHRQARLLSQIEFDRMNAGRGTAIVTGRKLKLMERKFILLHSPRRRIFDQPVELDAPPVWVGADRMAFAWRFVNPDRYTLSPEAEGPPPVVVSFDADSGLASVAGFDVAVQNETVAGGLVTAFGLATWDLPASDDLTQEIEYVQWTGSATTGPVRLLTSETGDTSARTPALAAGTIWRFRARNRAGGKRGTWSTAIYRTMTVAGSAPPAPVLDLAEDVGTETVTGTMTAPNAAVVRLRLWRTVAGAALDTGETPVLDRFTAPNQAHAVADNPGAGVWDYHGISTDAYGRDSAASAAWTVGVGFDLLGAGGDVEGGGGDVFAVERI
ncbi:hypothetical protein [Methylobrevis pamukkalensis]|uniref:Tip attachment protein J domain-containing protein n=1 Tax=Methylobrevis pamukkalensis TaxID=1439726 RepID=A0A1E3GZR1_9HYPH|nr:hypothetical protein [Methylobrevis pamukkalensis]ODN69559.1 hypothetical protein A6302_03153 [Methylobrevis pamukkalensis]